MQKRLEGKRIKGMRIHCGMLRKPVPGKLPGLVAGRQVKSVRRRAKYLLVDFASGTMVVHLGMSGSIRSDSPKSARRKHDHVEWMLARETLRYNDPRRFGCIYWCADARRDPVLERCGIEPLTRSFTGRRLHELAASRQAPIKLLLMDGCKIAGIGNIYACEALFRARIDPAAAAGSLTLNQCVSAVAAVKHVLRAAVRAGGSTLRNYSYGNERTGYFQQSHKVYGRAGQPCKRCATPIERSTLGQRSTFFCPSCQLGT